MKSRIFLLLNVFWLIIMSNVAVAGCSGSKCCPEDVPVKKYSPRGIGHIECCGTSPRFDGYDNKWLQGNPEDWVRYRGEMMKRKDARKKWTEDEQSLERAEPRCLYSYSYSHRHNRHLWKHEEKTVYEVYRTIHGYELDRSKSLESVAWCERDPVLIKLANLQFNTDKAIRLREWEDEQRRKWAVEREQIERDKVQQEIRDELRRLRY